MVAGPGGEAGPQGPLGQLLQAYLLEVASGAVGDTAADAVQVPAVGGDGVRRGFTGGPGRQERLHQDDEAAGLIRRRGWESGWGPRPRLTVACITALMHARGSDDGAHMID